VIPLLHHAGMPPSHGARHEVAVVRVEVRDQVSPSNLLIELLEVGRGPGSDRVLGRTTNVDDASRLLRDWLLELTKSVPER
jgi:hypothetical protein